MKARERKRERMVAKDAKKRAELTAILKSTSTDETVQNAKWDAMMALQKLPVVEDSKSQFDSQTS